MKCSKAAVHRKTHRIPEIRFEDQQLTSFAGLVMFQSLFRRIGLKQQLAGCFRHLTVSPIFGHGMIVLLLIVHLLLDYHRRAIAWFDKYLKRAVSGFAARGTMS